MESNPLSLADRRIRIQSGGISIAAKLTVLSTSAPVLILAHGFAGNMDEGGLFVGARDFFAGRGFSVLRFDFRGCGESGGDFRAVRLNDLAEDILNVVKFARSCEAVKPSAIGLVCFSLAAGVAILANPGHVGAHVFWSPAVYTDRDMAPRYRTPSIADQIARQGWFDKGGLQVGEQFLEDISGKQIERSLTRFRHPVLVVHGRNDQRIPSASSEELIRHLPRSSNLRLIPDADHSFRSQPTHREWLFSATAAWFSTRLGKVVVPPKQQALFRTEADNNPTSSQSR